MPLVTAGPSHTVRAMVVLPNASGLARDHFINTFHFFCESLSEENQTWISDTLKAFYNDPQGGGANSISDYISTAVTRGQPVKVKMYDLSDAKPRPVYEKSWTLDAPLSADRLPNEVACCLSYYVDRNIKRQRGRIYIGPLCRSAGGDVTGDLGPVLEMQLAISKAGRFLADAVKGADLIRWGVFSDTDNQLKVGVSGGWVDDRFDTVRRRGTRTTGRRLF